MRLLSDSLLSSILDTPQIVAPFNKMRASRRTSIRFSKECYYLMSVLILLLICHLNRIAFIKTLPVSLPIGETPK